MDEIRCKRCMSKGDYTIIRDIIPGLPLCEVCTIDVKHMVEHWDDALVHSPITQEVYYWRADNTCALRPWG